LNRNALNLSAGFVFSHDKNEVVDLGGRTFIPDALASGQGQSTQFTQRIIPGEPIGTFYGPVFVGVCQTACGNGADGLTGTPATSADDPKPGQQLFQHYTVDSNGNLVLSSNTTIAPSGNDYRILGNANPKYTFGIHTNGTWKAFDFSALINRVAGQKVFNNTALVYSTKGNALQDKNFLAAALNDPTGIKEPAIYSSRWIEDGSFTRLANITIGYTFDLPRVLGVARGTRVYVSGDNLHLWTGYTGYDPEVFSQLPGIAPRGVDYLHYPRPRTITGGLRVQF
jgi:iron complex outermembrane receptor protein